MGGISCRALFWITESGVVGEGIAVGVIVCTSIENPTPFRGICGFVIMGSIRIYLDRGSIDIFVVSEV